MENMNCQYKVVLEEKASSLTKGYFRGTMENLYFQFYRPPSEKSSTKIETVID